MSLHKSCFDFLFDMINTLRWCFFKRNIYVVNIIPDAVMLLHGYSKWVPVFFDVAGYDCSGSLIKMVNNIVN
jgi:hypothetical protein